MGDSFGNLLGELIDKTMVNLGKIASDYTEFANTCTVRGWVPPHPCDLIKDQKEDIPTQKTAKETRDANIEIPNFFKKDFLEYCKKHQNLLSFYHVNRLADMSDGSMTRKQVRAVIKKYQAEGALPKD